MTKPSQEIRPFNESELNRSRERDMINNKMNSHGITPDHVGILEKWIASGYLNDESVLMFMPMVQSWYWSRNENN